MRQKHVATGVSLWEAKLNTRAALVATGKDPLLISVATNAALFFDCICPQADACGYMLLPHSRL